MDRFWRVFAYFLGKFMGEAAACPVDLAGAKAVGRAGGRAGGSVGDRAGYREVESAVD